MWLYALEQNANQIKTVRLLLLVWTILDKVVCNLSAIDLCVVFDAACRGQVHGLLALNFVGTEDVARVDESQVLILGQASFCGERISASLVELIDLDRDFSIIDLHGVRDLDLEPQEVCLIIAGMLNSLTAIISLYDS